MNCEHDRVVLEIRASMQKINLQVGDCCVSRGAGFVSFKVQIESSLNYRLTGALAKLR